MFNKTQSIDYKFIVTNNYCTLKKPVYKNKNNNNILSTKKNIFLIFYVYIYINSKNITKLGA